MEKVVSFLKDLKQNNNKAWFEKNRDRYEESRAKILFLTDLLINEIRQFDQEIEPQDPKKCIFRLHRDVRFSKNKEPFKPNFGIFISKNGRKSRYSGYYLHIEPGKSFVGGGIYHPEAASLKILRKHIDKNADEFYAITNQPSFRQYFQQLIDHQLKTAPRDYLKVHPHIELLRYKSFAYSHALSDKKLLQDDYIQHVLKAFKTLHPFNAFLNRAFDNC